MLLRASHTSLRVIHAKVVSNPVEVFLENLLAGGPNSNIILRIELCYHKCVSAAVDTGVCDSCSMLASCVGLGPPLGHFLGPPAAPQTDGCAYYRRGDTCHMPQGRTLSH